MKYIFFSEILHFAGVGRLLFLLDGKKTHKVFSTRICFKRETADYKKNPF